MHLRQTIRADSRRFAKLAGRSSSKVTPKLLLHPRVLPVVLIRCSAKMHSKGHGRLASLISLINQIIFRVEVPARAEIGRGLVLPHPSGIVLGAAAIGEDVTIFQNVTIGARKFDAAYELANRPIIHRRVIIGAGAVVLGPVTIGEGATVAANSLVLIDVPPAYTALGVPAILLERKSQSLGGENTD